MRRDSNKNSVVILGLVVSLVAMAVGYAALSRQLTISGAAGTGTANWLIQFRSITKNDSLSTAGANEQTAPTASGTNVTFDVTFDYPGAKIVYDVVVENAGTIDATFVEVTGVDAANTAEPIQIAYNVEKTDSDTDLLNGNVDTYRVTIEWVSESDSVPTTTSKTATINLNYVQKVT